VWARLSRRGDLWEIVWAERSAHVPDMKGLGDLAVLLAQPGREVHCLDLAGAASPVDRGSLAGQLDGTQGGLGDVIDHQARTAYKQRVRELQEEIDDATEGGATDTAEHARAELDQLVTHLGSAYGLHGRVRQAGDPVERARSTVGWRIRNAIKRIEKADPDLAKHLRATVRTGIWCAYEPTDPVTWAVTAE